MITIPASGVKAAVTAESAKQLTLGPGIFQEQFDDVDVLRTRVRVASNADAKGLTEADLRGLRDGFIR